MAKINLQWTNPFFTANTATIPALEQKVERKVGRGAWETTALAITPDGVDPTIFKASDLTVTQDETEEVAWTYRILTKNGEYTVTGNELVIPVPATMTPVNDLTGTFEE